MGSVAQAQPVSAPRAARRQWRWIAVAGAALLVVAAIAIGVVLIAGGGSSGPTHGDFVSRVNALLAPVANGDRELASALSGVQGPGDLPPAAGGGEPAGDRDLARAGDGQPAPRAGPRRADAAAAPARAPERSRGRAAARCGGRPAHPRPRDRGRDRGGRRATVVGRAGRRGRQAHGSVRERRGGPPGAGPADGGADRSPVGERDRRAAPRIGRRRRRHRRARRRGRARPGPRPDRRDPPDRRDRRATAERSRAGSRR